MNTNIPLYTLNSPETDPFNLFSALYSSDSSWNPVLNDVLPPIIVQEYIYSECPWATIGEQTCEDRRRQLYLLGYI